MILNNLKRHIFCGPDNLQFDMHNEYLSNLPYSIVFHPLSRESGISYSDLEVTYQTPFRNKYCDVLISKCIHDTQESLQEIYRNIPVCLEKLRFHRILSQSNAIIWKYKNISSLDLNKIPNHELFSQAVIINENNSLIFSIRKIIETILQISASDPNISIGSVLKKLNSQSPPKIGLIQLEKDDLFFIKIINISTNSMKHSSFHEDINPIKFTNFDRFFAVDSVSVKDFNEKFAPSHSNPFFFWSRDEINDIQKIVQTPRESISFEYNIAMKQVMISFLLFMNKYIHNRHSELFQKNI